MPRPMTARSYFMGSDYRVNNQPQDSERSTEGAPTQDYDPG
jgi:hypothetical protein